MAVDEMLAHAIPGMTLHLDLKGGGAIEGEFVSATADAVTLQVDGSPAQWHRGRVTRVSLVTVDRPPARAAPSA